MIPCTADLNDDLFAQSDLQVRLVDHTRAEEVGSRTRNRPMLTLLLAAFDVDSEVDVRISPIDLAERHVERHAIVEVEQRRHIVVRPCGRGGQERYRQTEAYTCSEAHGSPPCA